MPGRLSLFLDYLPGEGRAAALCDDRLEDLLILRDKHPLYSGNCYWARVDALDAGLDAAFVDLGEGLTGFLPRSEVPRDLLGEGRKLSVGDHLAVRVVREPDEGKGPRVSARNLVQQDREKVGLIEAVDPLAAWLARQGSALDRIVVNNAALARRVESLLADEAKDVLAAVEIKSPCPDLFEQQGLEEAILGLLQPEVALPSGGSLIIESGRTLTAVDVNKGAMQHPGGSEAAHLALNLEAAGELARQLRLRNIAGRIVIDFPPLKRPEDKKALQGALKQALSVDYAGHKLLPLSVSGLQEITRKRSGASLADLLTEAVGIGGLGRRLTATTLAYAALRRAWTQILREPSRTAVQIKAAPRVAEALDNLAARAYVEESTGAKLTIVGDPGQSEFELCQ